MLNATLSANYFAKYIILWMGVATGRINDVHYIPCSMCTSTITTKNSVCYLYLELVRLLRLLVIYVYLIINWKGCLQLVFLNSVLNFATCFLACRFFCLLGNFADYQLQLLRGELIETFKIVTGKECIDKRQFFSLSATTSLRGHDQKLFKPRSRLHVRQKFFSQRIIDTWNKLPQEVVESTSINKYSPLDVGLI